MPREALHKSPDRMRCEVPGVLRPECTGVVHEDCKQRATKQLADLALVQSFPSQQGAVLIITLLIMIVMMLTSAAMLKSVDNSFAAVGNMSFQQRAQAPLMLMIESVIASLEKARQSSPDTQPTLPSYVSPNQLVSNNEGVPLALLRNNAAANGQFLSDRIDGITLVAAVEQMCIGLTGGLSDPMLRQKCVMREASRDNGSNTSHMDGEPGTPAITASDLPLFRITVRAIGDKNATALAQVFVHF